MAREQGNLKNWLALNNWWLTKVQLILNVLHLLITHQLNCSGSSSFLYRKCVDIWSLIKSCRVTVISYWKIFDDVEGRDKERKCELPVLDENCQTQKDYLQSPAWNKVFVFNCFRDVFEKIILFAARHCYSYSLSPV